jgi:RNA polymerase sigma factor (sigma-70 family)
MEPWRSQLNDGHAQVAWDLFVERYRRLILATIKRLVRDHDDVMDVFASVCQSLTANDFARLRSYSEDPRHAAAESSWLVIVVRNLTVDWIRLRDGRRRLSVPSHLSALRTEIYSLICADGHSHVEAYELIQARTGSALPFHEFLREVRATQLEAPCPDSIRARTSSRESTHPEPATDAFDPAESEELVRRLGEALSRQPSDVRLACELFVVERLPAADVARVVGWPNAKAVYNRVYRALEVLRAELKRTGIGPGDL